MNRNFSLLAAPITINISLMYQRSSVHSFLQILRKVTVLLHLNFLHTTVQIIVIRFKVLILISPKVQWHIMTPSESTFLPRLCIDSLTEFWTSVMHFMIKMFPLIKESASVHHTIIYIGLKNLPQCYSQLRWRSILSSMRQWNVWKKTSRTKMESITWWSGYNSQI